MSEGRSTERAPDTAVPQPMMSASHMLKPAFPAPNAAVIAAESAHRLPLSGAPRHAARRLRIAIPTALEACDFGAEVQCEMAGEDIKIKRWSRWRADALLLLGFTRLRFYDRGVRVRNKLCKPGTFDDSALTNSSLATSPPTQRTLGDQHGSRRVQTEARTHWLGPVLDPLLGAHASIAEQLKIASYSVLKAARDDADVRRMMTVPGVGPMTALAFKAAFDDPKRFTSSTKVGPYLGLTPRQYQSGESEWVGGIGKSNDPLLRSYLY